MHGEIKIQAYRCIALSDGWSILTLLALDTTRPQRRGINPTSRIFQVSPALKITAWPPGRRYPTGAIWYADQTDLLYGWDFCRPGHIYICRRNGTHVADLPLAPARKNLLQPRSFYRRGSRLYWVDTAGRRRTTPFPPKPPQSPGRKST